MKRLKGGWLTAFFGLLDQFEIRFQSVPRPVGSVSPGHAPYRSRY